ncbi:MAG: hypothetical protein JNJ98_20465 [Gemmatimonadetes bacterium]|nr:hypothetical protein [Gemmatimonadota bacterium]
MTMNANNKRAFDGFRPLVDFLDRHQVESSSANMKANRDALAAVSTRMTALAELREGARGGRQSRTAAYQEMRRRLEVEFLTPVRRLTRSIAGSDDTLATILRVRGRQDHVAQLAAARAVAAAASEHAAAFAQAGLRADYAEQLTALLDALTALHEARIRSQAESSGTVEALRVEARRGRFIVGLLDGVLNLVLERDPAVLAEWKSLRRRVSARVRESVEQEGVDGQGTQAAQARAA